MIEIKYNGNTMDVSIDGKHVIKNNLILTLRKLGLGPIRNYADVLDEIVNSYLMGMKVDDIDSGSTLKTLLEAMGDEEE